MNYQATLANLAWFGLNVRGYLRFQAALQRVQDVQELILNRYLRQNEDTVIGRKYGFSSIRSVQDYQARTPLSTYDDYLGFIEKIAAGEEGVLTREPVQLFEPSSGSTSAAKWIPYTSTLQAEFRRAVAPWVFDLFLRKPSLLGGPAYWSITPLMRTLNARPTRVPIGFQSDSAYLGGALKHVVNATLAVPCAVRHIGDIELFRRVTLLFLLRHRDLRLISVWHPSFLTLLLDQLRYQWDRILADIESGVHIADPRIDIPPSSSRARELSRKDPADLAGVWPHLRLISCWGDGHAEIYRTELQQLFSQIEIQTKGLIATEAFVSLPFREHKPLAVASHFFEFLDSDGRARLAWELDVGAVYSLVVTTGGGLYRYQLQDRVEVTGFLERTPCLRFLGRDDRVSDLFGEKLSEGFVSIAIDRVLASLGITPRFAMLAPETKAVRPHYALFIEVTGELPASLPSALEEALRENPHYEYCIKIGQLAPARAVRVRANAYGRYVTHLNECGQRLGDIKPSPFSSRTDWSRILKEAEPT